MMLRKLPKLKSLSWRTFFRGVFPLSCLIALLFLANAPVSAHSFAQASQLDQDPNTTACSSPIADTLSDGAIIGNSCFHVAYPTFFNQKAAMVNLSFFSSNPEQWKQCSLEMWVDDDNGKIGYTDQTYDCLQDAKQSHKEVSYGDYWFNAPFMVESNHTYQVVSRVSYQYGDSSSQMLIESQIYTV